MSPDLFRGLNLADMRRLRFSFTVKMSSGYEGVNSVHVIMMFSGPVAQVVRAHA